MRVMCAPRACHVCYVCATCATCLPCVSCVCRMCDMCAPCVLCVCHVCERLFIGSNVANQGSGQHRKMPSSWLIKLTQQHANLIRKESVPWCQLALIYNCVYEKHYIVPSVLGQSPSARHITWAIPFLWLHIIRKVCFKLFENFWRWLQL